MTAEPHLVNPRFDGDRLILEERHEGGFLRYAFPGTTPPPPGPLHALSLDEDLRALLWPAGTAGAVLRAWAEGAGPCGAVEVTVHDPGRRPSRTGPGRGDRDP